MMIQDEMIKGKGETKGCVAGPRWERVAGRSLETGWNRGGGSIAYLPAILSVDLKRVIAALFGGFELVDSVGGNAVAATLWHRTPVAARRVSGEKVTQPRRSYFHE